MKYFMTIVFPCIYTMLFMTMIFIARNKFEAWWIIGIVGLPLSLIGNYVSNVADEFLGVDYNVVIDGLLMYIFGILQYGLIGYLADKIRLNK